MIQASFLKLVSARLLAQTRSSKPSRRACSIGALHIKEDFLVADLGVDNLDIGLSIAVIKR